MYKIVNIVMLPTEHLTEITLNSVTNTLLFDKVRSNPFGKMNEYGQYIYAVSDDLIEKNDWVYHPTSKAILQCHSIEQIKYKDLGWMKVIASSDSSLKLPSFHEEFLKGFCKMGGVKEVKVKYRPIYGSYPNESLVGHIVDTNFRHVIARFIKSEIGKNYTKEEVIELMKRTWETAWEEAEQQGPTEGGHKIEPLFTHINDLIEEML